MPVKRVIVTNYNEFKDVIQDFEHKKEPVFLYIVGAKGPDGKSWCPDCENVSPIVDNFIATKVSKKITLVRIELDRTYFKNRRNPFRQCHKVRLTKVPTLIYWGNVRRLEENECANKDLLRLFFEGF